LDPKTLRSFNGELDTTQKEAQTNTVSYFLKLILQCNYCDDYFFIDFARKSL
jgi:hypothetical protein